MSNGKEMVKKKMEYKNKIISISLVTASCIVITYYFIIVLEKGTVYTHLFYIPIILASLWWGRKGIYVSVFLSIFLLLNHLFLRTHVLWINDIGRVLMFCIVGFFVGTLSERKNHVENKLKEYSERLEEKVDERTKEIKHLNLVLRAIRKVNQLIIKERDRDTLIQGACDNLIKTRGFYNAWIVLLDETHKVVRTAEAGLDKDFTPMAEQLKRGKLPHCIQRALKQSDVVVIKDPLSICTDCVMVEKCSPNTGAMTVRLECGGKIYGVLYATVSADFIINKEEQILFKEMGGDIAFGLYSIEGEEKHKRLEQQREKARKEAEFYADVLAHDVGNINQITMGYLYLLQIAKDEETKKKNVEGIKKSIMNSKRLAESIKTLKIIKDTKIEKFDLNESIERSLEEIKSYFNKEIEVKLDIDKHYYVKANDFLDRVFFNILENSVEHTFKDKVIIDIKTEEKDGFCNVHIHDNGLGISKEKKKDILENLETLSKRTGMGFYLIKKILERFNGKFEIKDVKKGTEIVVSIPVMR